MKNTAQRRCTEHTQRVDSYHQSMKLNTNTQKETKSESASLGCLSIPHRFNQVTQNRRPISLQLLRQKNGLNMREHLHEIHTYFHLHVLRSSETARHYRNIRVTGVSGQGEGTPTSAFFRLFSDSIKVSRPSRLLHGFCSLLGRCKTSFITVISFVFKNKAFYIFNYGLRSAWGMWHKRPQLSVFFLA